MAGISLEFYIRGQEKQITPSLYEFKIPPRTKSKLFEKQLYEINQINSIEEELIIDEEERFDDEEEIINLRPYLILKEYDPSFARKSMDQQKQLIYGVLSDELTRIIRSAEGSNQRFSIFSILKDLSQKYNIEITDMAPRLVSKRDNISLVDLLLKKKKKKKKNNNNKKNKIIYNEDVSLIDLLKDNEEEKSSSYDDEDEEVQEKQKKEYYSLKNPYIIPVAILPIIFNEIAINQGLVRFTNTICVNQIFDEFIDKYNDSMDYDLINSEVVNYHMIKQQIKILKINNNFIKYLYQRLAFKYLKQQNITNKRKRTIEDDDEIPRKKMKKK